MTENKNLTHLGRDGSARMVDITDKPKSLRFAIAAGNIRMKSETLNLIISGSTKKGDVVGTARIAGIMAAKKTHELVPLCHQLQLTKISVEIEPDENLPGLLVRAEVKVTGSTGVEMEALTAVSVACLTIYDMAKAVDRGMIIGDIQLIEKSGGRSGQWKREA